MSYAHIRNNTLLDITEVKYLNEDILNLDVTEEIYNAFLIEPRKFIYDVETNSIIKNPSYEAEQAAKKEEQIKMFKMTRGDLFEYTIMSKGLDEADIRALIEKEETLDTITKKLYLNRLDNALYFYRGHPAVDFIGNKLGLTKDELDALFEEKNAVE